jgi:hypothetical protein
MEGLVLNRAVHIGVFVYEIPQCGLDLQSGGK